MVEDLVVDYVQIVIEGISSGVEIEVLQVEGPSGGLRSSSLLP